MRVTIGFAALAVATIVFSREGNSRLGASGGVDVVTYHNDVARTGQNLGEVLLTPVNVNPSSFGKVAFLPLDGKVDAQPVFLSAVTFPAVGARNVLYVATEHDTIYAIDTSSESTLWSKSLLGTGESPSDARGCGQVTPEIGITSTPVIDRARGAIYVVAMSKTTGGAYVQRIHALDILTGAELFGGPVDVHATFPGGGAGSSQGVETFDPKQYEERAALLLVNGVLVTAWTSHCDIDPYTGWVMAYDAGTLAQTSVLNLTPNGSRGGIWMAGDGPAADAIGNIYLLDGNGTFDPALDQSGFPVMKDYGNGFLKISTSGGLGVADYFEMFNTVAESNADADLGSGGCLLLPDLLDASGVTRHLAVGAGKDAHLYVVDRDSMGKWNASSNQNYQDLANVLGGGSFSTPAYFGGTLFYGAAGTTMKAFAVTDARVSSTVASSTAQAFPYPGTTPSVSANGAANAIVWAVENAANAVLHAYDAHDLSHELYNSNQSGSRDAFGPGNKFMVPTIVNGFVYVGTANGVVVFGSLIPGAPRNLRIVVEGS